MEQDKRSDKGNKNRKLDGGVLHEPGGPGSTEPGGKLRKLIEDALKNWNSHESTFLTRYEDHGFILKLLSLAHDEECRTRVIRQHGGVISLLGVFGRAKKYARERLLGYILIYAGTPIIHSHTWFVSIAYSDADDIRRKDPTLIVNDDNVRLYKAGIGKCDYLFSYKAKTREHDEAGFSDGAAHLETAGQWRDGL